MTHRVLIHIALLNDLPFLQDRLPYLARSIMVFRRIRALWPPRGRRYPSNSWGRSYRIHFPQCLVQSDRYQWSLVIPISYSLDRPSEGGIRGRSPTCSASGHWRTPPERGRRGVKHPDQLPIDLVLRYRPECRSSRRPSLVTTFLSSLTTNRPFSGPNS